MNGKQAIQLDCIKNMNFFWLIPATIQDYKALTEKVSSVKLGNSKLLDSKLPDVHYLP